MPSDMARPDYDDPDVEEAWANEQRVIVRDYLAAQRIAAVDVPSAPEWLVAPYIAVWVVEVTTGEAIWVISGDMPTDYLPFGQASIPREAVRAFGVRWERVAGNMLAGRRDPEVTIGRPEEQAQLGDLLSRRASLLQEFAQRDEYWDE